MARAIDGEAAYRFLSEQLVKETGAFSKGVNKGLNIARSAMRNPDAIPALRPVSRERVEQVWRGCEYCSGDVDNRSYLDSKRLYLDGNGILTDEIEDIDILRLDFCPICGKPLTDEAVDMVMERLEKIK